jgi:hypothetical protein
MDKQGLVHNADEAYDILKQAETFGHGPTGFAHSISLEEQALAFLLQQPGAAEKLKKLLKEPGLPAQVYALWGLYQVDADTAKKAAELYYKSDKEVATLHGDIGFNQPLASVVQSLSGIGAPKKG